MQTEAEKRAKKKYDDKTAVRFGLKLNRKTDADIIERLKATDGVQPYLKRLIREDIERNK